MALIEHGLGDAALKKSMKQNNSIGENGLHHEINGEGQVNDISFRLKELIDSL